MAKKAKKTKKTRENFTESKNKKKKNVSKMFLLSLCPIGWLSIAPNSCVGNLTRNKMGKRRNFTCENDREVTEE